MSDLIEPVIVEGEGLTVSLLVWRKFRRPMPGLAERILDLNPGLADLGAFIPVGTEVLVPIPTPRPAKVVEPVTVW